MEDDYTYTEYLQRFSPKKLARQQRVVLCPKCGRCMKYVGFSRLMFTPYAAFATYHCPEWGCSGVTEIYESEDG